MERRERSLRGPNATTSSSSGNNTGPLNVSTSLPTLTPAQMYNNFEEWIKMCTDNKVNATNSWNFALIDYFHEMTFIREGDSINFQKASCTLDGCVKIYTSRVDSVATETGKLLSGLADSREGEDIDLQDENGERRTRRRMHRSENTLLKDFSSIALKKFDLDFSVDPLFKKTSADFDEGGARGLLLNHLGIDGDCKIIFDASDATIETEESYKHEEEEDEEEEDKEEGEQHEEENKQEEENKEEEKENNDPMDIDEQNPTQEKEMDIDELIGVEKKDQDEVKNDDENKDGEQTEKTEDESTQLNDNLLEEPDASQAEQIRIEITRLKEKLPSFDIISQLNIMPSLHGYDFFSENDTELPNPNLSMEAMNQANANDNAMDEAPPFNGYDDYGDYGDFDMPDFDQGDDIYPNEGDVPVDPFADDDDGNDENGEPNDDLENEGMRDLDGDERPFQDQDFLTSIINSGEKDLYNYFDNTLVKNWAGPEHWKLRKIAPTRLNDENASENGEKTRKKSTKSTFQIEFLDGEDEDENILFETSNKKTVTSKEATTQKLALHLLPDDIHFSSKQLLQYFLKPMFSNRPKKRNFKNSSNDNNNQTDASPLDEPNGLTQPDIDFWAEQGGMNNDVDIDYDDGQGIDMDFDLPTDMLDGDQTMLSALEDSSYYQNNIDYPDPETSALYGDALVTSQMKKTKPLYVNYARTAKRVDVKKLKENIWKALTFRSDDDKIQGIQKFTDIMHILKRMYPAKAMQDISIPFCFICLLHLANEKDLSIIRPNQVEEDDDDFVLGETDSDWLTNETVLNEVTIMQNAV
ncbi:barren [Backusella circina FSU 941]|nr:barren [Backusella circina FSU 941]